MAFIFPVRVYYSDTDAGGVVYHARYLDFAEHARTELLRSVSSRFPEGSAQQQMLSSQKLAFVVRSVTVEYLKPAYLDDMLEVATDIYSAKRFSMIFGQEVRRNGELIATLSIKVAAIDVTVMRPVEIPEWILQAIKNL